MTIVYRVYFRYVGADQRDWEAIGRRYPSYQQAAQAAEELKSDPQIAETDILDQDVS